MPDLEGNLSVFQPISVMQMLNLAGATGELVVTGDANSANIFFEQGNVTFAGIANRPLKLGEYLVREGLVTESALNGVLKKHGRQKKRIGDLLVEADLIQRSELEQAVETQIMDVIYEVVRWQSGRFSFEKNKVPPAREIRIDIPLDHLLLEGLKRLDEERVNTK
ncbi:MAG: DUF4388 domain-containing protein [Candidatus Latescibacterota bacterium]|nr:MAG: DUF4388 domain-containing protein [Candidatus Latescibacterota bacterium]